jgi:hypothetical protein
VLVVPRTSASMTAVSLHSACKTPAEEAALLHAVSTVAKEQLETLRKAKLLYVPPPTPLA